MSTIILNNFQIFLPLSIYIQTYSYNYLFICPYIVALPCRLALSPCLVALPCRLALSPCLVALPFNTIIYNYLLICLYLQQFPDFYIVSINSIKIKIFNSRAVIHISICLYVYICCKCYARLNLLQVLATTNKKVSKRVSSFFYLIFQPIFI